MKRRFIVLVIISIILSISPAKQTFANTSFVVKSEHTLYAANLDLNDSVLNIRIVNKDDKRVFFVSYSGILTDRLVGYLPTVSMNDEGLFFSTQIQSVDTSYPSKQVDIETEIGELTLNATAQFDTVEEVIKNIGSDRLVNSEALLHSLVADKTGASVILEAGDNNIITTDDRDFTILTDLPAGTEVDTSTDTLLAADKARYNMVNQYLQENINDFTVDKAFVILQKAARSWKGGGTLCSMVFDPENGEVYLALNRDYSKLWKVTIAQGIIETVKGFKKNTVSYISSGITSEELLHPKSFLQKYGSYLIVTGVIFLLIVCFNVKRRKRNKSFIPKQMEW